MNAVRGDVRSSRPNGFDGRPFAELFNERKGRGVGYGHGSNWDGDGGVDMADVNRRIAAILNKEGCVFSCVRLDFNLLVVAVVRDACKGGVLNGDLMDVIVSQGLERRVASGGNVSYS